VLKPGEYDNCFVDTGTVKPFEPLKKAARDNSLQGYLVIFVKRIIKL